MPRLPYPAVQTRSVPGGGCVAVPVDFMNTESDYNADYFVAATFPAGCSATDLR